ncbi:MAG: hypothetical protein ACI8PZ_004112 [Myxococcota bacterium]|jgi:hypothetical protein
MTRCASRLPPQWADLGLDGPPPDLAVDIRRKQERTQGEAVWTPAFAHTDPERMGVAQLVP